MTCEEVKKGEEPRTVTGAKTLQKDVDYIDLDDPPVAVSETTSVKTKRKKRSRKSRSK